MFSSIEFSHTLLDAARMLDQMEKAKELNLQYTSLYQGSSDEALSIVAPYLFIYKEGTEFARWLSENGWGDAWGIFLYSDASMNELHRHLRKFLRVKTEDGHEVYFRFCDPRVLRVFLPTCNESQLVELFGPVRYFVVEDEDPNYALLFYLYYNQLETQRIPVKYVPLENIL